MYKRRRDQCKIKTLIELINTLDRPIINDPLSLYFISQAELEIYKYLENYVLYHVKTNHIHGSLSQLSMIH